MPLRGGATDLNETGGSDVPRFAAQSRGDADGYVSTKLNDLSRSPSPLSPDGTLIAIIEIELSLSSWPVAGIVPGVERQPLRGPRSTRAHC
jgi:hypothetical protein